MPIHRDLYWMDQALRCAEEAATQAEVPVGAVLVEGETLLARSGNQPILRHDPTAHAEILVLREATTQLKNDRLPNATLYVTLEPCPMCLWALLQTRIKRIVFGAYDMRSGALGSAFNLLAPDAEVHRPEVLGGIRLNAASTLLKAFFKDLRAS